MSEEIHSWAEGLASFYDYAWDRILYGVNNRHAAARHPTLATVSADGLPQARTVVLRHADRLRSALQIYTHAQSFKIDEVRANPVAALHVWDKTAHLQIRILADVAIASGDDVETIWSGVPDASRKQYRRDTAPGMAIPESLAYESVPDVGAFAVVNLSVRVIDLLHLGSQHRRAKFAREDGWAGRWIAP
jgi:hypothetical protein